MGLANYILEGVVREHSYQPVSGSVVQIGRQTVELTASEMAALFARYGLTLSQDNDLELDCETTQVRQTGKPFVSDKAFFKSLGAFEVRAVDHSDFEGADIVHDMNLPMDSSLESIADLILDGSTLDNVHDPAMALMNYNRMLRPGGRVVSINAAKPDIQGAYTGMSPEWFLDYYAANGYRDCGVYAQLNFPAKRWGGANGPIALLAMDYNWVLEHKIVPPLRHEGWAYTIVVAEKGTDSTWDKTPIRGHLRGDDEQTRWLESVARFSRSRRPSFVTTMRPDFAVPRGFVSAQ